MSARRHTRSFPRCIFQRGNKRQHRVATGQTLPERLDHRRLSDGRLGEIVE